MYKIICSCVIIFSVCLLSCTKDPVSNHPLDRNTTESYPATLGDLSSFLATGYSNFRKDFFLYGFDLLTKEFACSEHAACLAYNPEQDWDELATNQLSVYNLYASRLWKGLYTGVKNTNVFFERADFFVNNYAKGTDTTEVNKMRGQAYFLRAFYYFNLECFFGESYISPTSGSDKLGVPIFTSLAETIDDTHHPRSTARQVWDLIINDLKMSS